MASLLSGKSRRYLVLSLCGLPLLGCANPGRIGESVVTTPPNAERIYIVYPIPMEGEETYITRWVNRPSGPRVPGPYPLPVPNRLQIGSGFPQGLEQPALAFNKPKPIRKRLYDAFDLGFFWVVSETLRATLLEIDPTGFDGVLARTEFSNGEPGPNYWLLDLVRFVDCYDVARSVAANPLFVDEHGTVGFAADGHFFHADAVGAASARATDCHEVGV